MLIDRLNPRSLATLPCQPLVQAGLRLLARRSPRLRAHLEYEALRRGGLRLAHRLFKEAEPSARFQLLSEFAVNRHMMASLYKAAHVIEHPAPGVSCEDCQRMPEHLTVSCTLVSLVAATEAHGVSTAEGRARFSRMLASASATPYECGLWRDLAGTRDHAARAALLRVLDGATRERFGDATPLALLAATESHVARSCDAKPAQEGNR